MTIIPKLLIPALAYLYLVGGQSPCLTPDGKNGDCKSLLECAPLRKAAIKPSADEVDFLRKSACGFVGKIPKVCCVSTDTCFTPEGGQGQCKKVLECKHIAEMLQSQMVTAEVKAYVNSIRCENPYGFSVCCAPPPQTGRCEPSASPPDPRTKCCGIDASSSSKILHGNTTFIDQYPWLAIIEYKKGNQIKVLCGGVLISGRYVLTAAHCVVGTPDTVGTPANVRLGDYNISNSGRDCTPTFDGGEDCTEDLVVIAIERIVSHPGYSQSSPLRRNDIAMLRLEELAPYTDFIRPICLPTTDVTFNISSTDILYAAGWGLNTETNSSSDVVLHVHLSYKSIETCQTAYNVSTRRVPLWNGQLCAGGEKGKDTCKGDSGGPLMYPGAVFEVIGLGSFGARPCGLEDTPGVYTKVYEYLPWIRSNIQP